MAIIGIALFVAILIQIVLFIPAFTYKTDKLTDMSYAATFFLLGLLLFFFNKYTTHKLILLLMITAWSFRLAIYMYSRIKRMVRDARFDGIREDFFRFFGFWLFQGTTVWIIMIPTALYFAVGETKLTALTIIGFVVWLKGFLIETIADYQKFVFKNKPENRTKWIATGLWKYSRHPNYYGEILCWLGVYLFAISALTGFNILIAFISPAFIALLLVYYSGIPGLEKMADKKYGQDKQYQKYKKNTSPLILWPPKEQQLTFKQTYATTTISTQEFLKSYASKVKNKLHTAYVQIKPVEKSKSTPKNKKTTKKPRQKKKTTKVNKKQNKKNKNLLLVKKSKSPKKVNRKLQHFETHLHKPKKSTPKNKTTKKKTAKKKAGSKTKKSPSYTKKKTKRK